MADASNENMTLAEQKALLARFAKAAGAGEMLNIHDLNAAYEKAIGHPTSDSTPYSPELNPKENLWDEIREKIFKNYALKSMDAVRAKLKQAILYMERNPKLVRSITSFPYIANSL
jgi:hypothetical protein